MKHLLSLICFNLIIMLSTAQEPVLFPTIQTFFNSAASEFIQIPSERKNALKELSQYISQKKINKNEVSLTFICTHNSRRSHIAQIMAQAAAAYFGINHVNCFSGGTEVTAFNKNAVNALRKIGFEITAITNTSNPFYEVKYSSNFPALMAFSKEYSSTANPQKNFGAILTCNQADASCPIVNGADGRFKISYQDPKLFDGTPEQDQVYAERCKQIAIEMLYVFSLIKK